MNSHSEQLNAIEGERGIPDVNTQSSARWKRGAMVLVVCGTLAAGALVAHLKFGQADNSVESTDAQRTMTTASTVKPRTFIDIPADEPAPVAAMPAPVEPIVPIIRAPAEPIRPIKAIKRAPTLDKAATRSAVSQDRIQPAAMPVSNQSGSTNMSDGFFGNSSNPEAETDSGSLASSLRSTTLTQAAASLLGDRSLLVTQGSFIDCALNTRLDSTVPGMTSCVVTRDVFSDNGKLVMIERGSQVTGEYRSNLKQGMSRIFVLWNRVKTPEGVVIDLASPSTDSLGASGITGHVDNHFWKRFGGAFLLSLVDDVARAATTSSTSNENSQIVLNSAGSVSSDLAAEILRNTINIPPTLYANQGARVGIFVARDLDFSGVYAAVPR